MYLCETYEALQLPRGDWTADCTVSRATQLFVKLLQKYTPAVSIHLVQSQTLSRGAEIARITTQDKFFYG